MGKRPKIKVPYQSVDILLELLSITLLLLMFGYTIIEYASLPETIPTHFNARGEADDFGDKLTLWFVPAIALVMYIGIFIINMFPHTHNYMVNITQENALKNYTLSTRVLRIVNLFTMLILGIITYKIISSAKGENFSLGSWFLPVIIGTSLILPIVILIYYKKMNK